MKKALLHQALRTALRDLPSHPHPKFKHWSFLVIDQRILGQSTNTYLIPPKHFGYQKELKHRPLMHSEIAVFLKLRGLIRDRRFSLINVRLNRFRELRRSSPCKCCFSLLSSLGCKEFVEIVGIEDTLSTMTWRY